MLSSEDPIDILHTKEGGSSYPTVCTFRTLAFLESLPCSHSSFFFCNLTKKLSYISN